MVFSQKIQLTARSVYKETTNGARKINQNGVGAIVEK